MSSSKKRRTDFSRGKKDDPKAGVGRRDEETALVGCALVGALGAEEEGDIDGLVRESAEEGLRMRAEKERLEAERMQGEELILRENSISQCEEAGHVYARDIGEIGCIEQVDQESPLMEKSSHVAVQPFDRLTFESRREKEGVEPEASWRRAFDDCRHLHFW